MTPPCIIALDLDGTLLDSQKRLSARNRAALVQAASRGAYVVPVTGRFFGMMPECVRDLPCVRYAITVNGAQVYDRQTESALVRAEIPRATALDVMALLDSYDVIYDCYRNNWGWMTQTFKDKAPDYATDGHYLKMIYDYRNGVRDLQAHLRETPNEGDVQKIMLFLRRGLDTNILQGLAQEIATRFPTLKVTQSTANNLEINLATAHKGVALDHLARALGLTLADCMAFGDGGNDLTMIEAAGCGIAMANAVPAVKAAAREVTESNDEDGVARALIRHGLANG